MLWRTYEGKCLTQQVPGKDPEANYARSNLKLRLPEARANPRRQSFEWSTTQFIASVMDRTTAVYQHGSQPKVGDKSWPSVMVQDPWGKDFLLQELPTVHKVPKKLPLMPAFSTEIKHIKNSDIAPSWFKAFAARATHLGSLANMLLEGSILLLCDVMSGLRQFFADVLGPRALSVSEVDELLQVLSSALIESQKMHHHFFILLVSSDVTTSIKTSRQQ